MLNIVVFSDSHGKRARVATLAARTKPDVVLFLGDGLCDLDALPDGVDVRAVRGNCDFFTREDTPYARIVTIGAYRIFLTHGHREGVKGGEQAAIARALDEDADVLLYGHTHRATCRTYPAGTTLCGKTLTRPLTVLCPGSLGDTEATFATLTLTPHGILPNVAKL